jgi:hypothetical protein
MNTPDPEIDNTHVYLQVMLHRVRHALNECPVDSQLALRSLRSWLDVCIRYEKEQRVRPVSEPNDILGNHRG